MGAGGLDVAVAMGGGAYYLTAPQVINVHLTGSLRPWVTAKDVVLEVLKHLTTKGNVGCVCEYTGEGIDNLTVPERATSPTWAQTGVAHPSSLATARPTDSWRRRAGDRWVPLAADDDAKYGRTIEIDLSEIEPLAAAPPARATSSRSKTSTCPSIR